jgi:transcriptional regulator with XRE-family HTH domain
MENQNSGNYLRAHRKRSGLSQDEIAAALGCEDGGVVSRHEAARIFPPLPLALAYEVIFLVPVSQLFRGLRDVVEQTTEDRLSKLEVELGTRSGAGPQAAITAKKLIWLAERRSLRTSA